MLNIRWFTLKLLSCREMASSSPFALRTRQKPPPGLPSGRRAHLRVEVGVTAPALEEY